MNTPECLALTLPKARYENELLESVTPFWTKNFVDRECGGFYSFLDDAGAVYCTDKYLWMQWRSVYMLSEMHLSKYSKPEWLELAEHGFGFAFKHGRRPDGSYRFALDRRGNEINADGGGFPIFSASFAGLASASLFESTGKPEYKEEAISSIDAYIKAVWDTTQTAIENGTPLSFAHYMIMVNLCDEFKRHTGDARYDGDVARSVSFMMRFHNPMRKCTHESVNVDGAFYLDSMQGRLLNPGHTLEGMWFLLRHAETSGDRELLAYACEHALETLNYGWDYEHGGIFYFKDLLGRPLAEPKAQLKAWWPQNEAAVAALYAYKASGNPAFLEWFERIDQWAWTHFRDAGRGEWYMYRCPDGSFFSNVKGSAYKTFFHVPRYLLRCLELMDSLEQGRGG